MNDYRPVPEKATGQDKPIVAGEYVVANEPVIGGKSVGRTIPHDSAVGHVTGCRSVH